MLTSITPLGERGRHRNWNTTIVAYFIGSILGGTVVGALTGGLGELVPRSARPGGLGYMVAAVLGLVILDELKAIRVTPLGKRQVSEDWLDEYRGWVVGLGFGFQLGLGFTTIVTTLALPATFLLAILTFSWQWGLVIGVAFGTARALPILTTRRVTSPDELAELHRHHDRSERWVRIAAAVIAGPLAFAAVAL
jgi:MFS family permease